jgi:hypothetical protein
MQSEDCDPAVVVGNLGPSEPRAGGDRTTLAPGVLRRTLGLDKGSYDGKISKELVL